MIIKWNVRVFELIHERLGLGLGQAALVEEVAEDLRLVCAQELYPERYKFLEYALCRAAAGRRDDSR